MPWKSSSVMEERLRFVARLLDGEAMTDVCREFGVERPLEAAASFRRSTGCQRKLHGAQTSG
jgi:hypothetical protein